VGKCHCCWELDFRLCAHPCKTNTWCYWAWFNEHHLERFETVKRTWKGCNCGLSFWCAYTSPEIASKSDELIKESHTKEILKWTCLMSAAFAVWLSSSKCITITEDWKTSESLSWERVSHTNSEDHRNTTSENTWILKTNGFFRSFKHFKAGLSSRVRRVCTKLQKRVLMATNAKGPREGKECPTQMLHALQSWSRMEPSEKEAKKSDCLQQFLWTIKTSKTLTIPEASGANCGSLQGFLNKACCETGAPPNWNWRYSCCQHPERGNSEKNATRMLRLRLTVNITQKRSRVRVYVGWPSFGTMSYWATGSRHRCCGPGSVVSISRNDWLTTSWGTMCKAASSWVAPATADQ
jgi:hypothetical protein